MQIEWSSLKMDSFHNSDKNWHGIISTQVSKYICIKYCGETGLLFSIILALMDQVFEHFRNEAVKFQERVKGIDLNK